MIALIRTPPEWMVERFPAAKYRCEWNGFNVWETPLLRESEWVWGDMDVLVSTEFELPKLEEKDGQHS